MSYQPASITAVETTSPFHLQLDDLMRKSTLPSIISSLRATGRFYALSWTPETAETKTHCFWDSDLYKTMEACCYYLMKRHDSQLLADVEEAVGYIRAAAWKDGYINSYFTLYEPQNRLTNLRDMHELYCLGHLAEFAAAYFFLTGSHTLIDVVRGMVELIVELVLPKGGYPGHEELELGLMRLFDITHDNIFLDTVESFVRERGTLDEKGYNYFDREAMTRGGDPFDAMGPETKNVFRFPRDYAYMQAHAALVEQSSIEGHCVRAMYLLIGAQHYALAKPSKTKDIRDAVQRLFYNTVYQKMYITGGIGSVAQNEGFGPDYWLPSERTGGCCYSETCAAFGLIMLCERLLRGGLKGVYGDVMERALLNCVLGAVGMEGGSFYYENPLATLEGAPWNRSTWFDVACCPPNVAKLLGLLPSLAFSTRGATIAIHLFIASKFTTKVNGQDVTVKLESGLPWEGSVKLEVEAHHSSVELAIRIPAWAGDEFTTSARGEIRDGYLFVSVAASSDAPAIVDLYFPVQPRFAYAHPSTRKDEIAVTRGPLIYCAESPDNDIDLGAAYIRSEHIEDVRTTHIAGVTGIPVLEVKARIKTGGDMNCALYSTEKPEWEPQETRVALIPFFLRANRGGNGAMRVWLRKLASEN